MQTNGLTIPDESVVTEYIPDPIGGWVYLVTTSVRVEQQAIASFGKNLDAAKERLTRAQQEVDTLTAQSANITVAIETASAESKK